MIITSPTLILKNAKEATLTHHSGDFWQCL